MNRITLTRAETAKALQVSLPILDAWLHRAENPIPCIRAGRKVLIPAEELSRWINDETARNQRGNAAVSGR